MSYQDDIEAHRKRLHYALKLGPVRFDQETWDRHVAEAAEVAKEDLAMRLTHPDDAPLTYRDLHRQKNKIPGDHVVLGARELLGIEAELEDLRCHHAALADAEKTTRELYAEARKVFAACPLGHADGRLIYARSTTEAEIASWVESVYEMARRLHVWPPGEGDTARSGRLFAEAWNEKALTVGIDLAAPDGDRSATVTVVADPRSPKR